MTTELILGGARSGKSRLAEQRAIDSGLAVTYVATGEARDAEMARRIAHHRVQRPSHWALAEEPLHLAAALRAHAAPGHCLLVDCLTLWLSNLLCSGTGAAQAEAGEPVDCALLDGEVDALIDYLPQLPGHVILVGNEVGQGIVPLGATNRLYVDTAGRLHQRAAAVCDRVTLVVAGLPLQLK